MEGFSDFIDKSFSESKKWRSINFHEVEKLVVDSRDLFEWLYLSRHPWEFGGELDSFYMATREFFWELLSSRVQLVIVLHGPQPHDKKKLDFLRKCRTEANDKMWKLQRQRRWQPVGIQSHCTVPHLAWSVFIHVISKLELSYRVTSEAGVEGRREICALANHHRCPVLGSSSDYHLFELDHGYIPLHTISTIIASGLLYHVDDFCERFSLKSSQLRLLVPAVYGSATLEATCASREDLTTFLNSVSKFENCDAYLAAESRESVKDKVSVNVDTATKLYSSINFQSYSMESFFEADFPEFLRLKVKEGFLDIEFFNIIKRRMYVLPNIVECVSKETAWLASRSIRQYSYGMLLESRQDQVKEILRAKASPEVTEVMVSPVHFTPPVKVKDISDSRDVKNLRKLLLLVLSINDSAQPDFLKVFEMLDRNLKLPVCAATYWYRNGDSIQRHLVKSLVLSILTCSGMVGFNERSVLEPLTADTKQDHFSSLHGFAQWQCIYHDLMNLNFLLHEPFITVNPALLFSGKVAMFYASFVRKSRSPDEVLHRSSEAWAVYNDCLFLVTGSDADKRKSVKVTPKPVVKPQPQRALGLSNRFDALELIDD